MAAGGASALPAVHDSGEGPALLFLHAFPLDSSQWDHQVAALSGEFRCLRVDMWGCGSSPAPPETPSLSAFAGDLLRALDERGVDSFVACGCSMGGYVVLELLRLAPQRVAKLVLCSTRATHDNDAGRANREQTAQRVLSGGVEAIVEENLQRLVAPSAQREVHIADPLRGRIRRCTADGIAWALRAMGARPDSTGMLASIEVSTLVLAGADDTIIPSHDQRAMAAAIPRAEFVEFGTRGHLPNLEDPPVFNEALTQFLAAKQPA